MSALTTMHHINKATENSHVKTNLVHTLLQMRKVGTLEINFKDLLTLDEMAVASKLAKDKNKNKSWYNLLQAKFLEYIYSIRFFASY